MDISSPMRLILFIFSILIWVRGSDAFDLTRQVHSFKLSNGMQWLVVPRPHVPVFSGIVMVKAGGVDEVPSKTGLAHMFEHMAFKGSKKVGTKNFTKEVPLLNEIAKLGREMSLEGTKPKPDFQRMGELKKRIQELTAEEYRYMNKNQIWETLTRKGAQELNAFTTKDVTAYHASMPIEHFPLWFYFTSEMILDPVLREFYQERDVVIEERRLRYDNSPFGFLYEILMEQAFGETPYSWAPIGHFKDLLGLTMEDALEFHRRFYIPKNMTGVLVGALTLEEAKPVLEKYFGRFPFRKGDKQKTDPPLSFQKEKRKKVSFPAEPYFLMAFHKPKAPAREDYVFDMLDELLCEGRTGRLYQKLVKDEKIASNVSCSGSFPGSRLHNLFVIFVSPIKRSSLREIEKLVSQELRAIGETIDTKEIEKVRRSVLYTFFWSLEDNLELAEQLAAAQTVLGDWHYVVNYPKVIESISIEEIQTVAKKYFKSENRIIIYRLKGKRKT